MATCVSKPAPGGHVYKTLPRSHQQDENDVTDNNTTKDSRHTNNDDNDNT